MHQTGPQEQMRKVIGMLAIRFMFTKSVTMLVAVSDWQLFFTKCGMKTNRQYCLDK